MLIIFLASHKNVLIVTQGTIQGPNEFNSIKAAVDTILFNSATNPYVVLVGPGVYIEDTITLKEFVSIIGESPLSCIVQVDDPSKDLLIAAPNAYIEKLTLSGATDPGKAALVFSGGNGAFQAFNCIFGSNDILVNQSASVAPHVPHHFASVAQMQTHNLPPGFNITDNGAIISVMEIGDWTWLCLGNPLISEFAKIAGNLTFFVGNTVNIGSLGFIGGRGFVIENGASVNIDSATISGFNNGIVVPNLGSGPILNISGVYSRNNLADLRIDNPFTTGSISGAFARAKTFIDATVQLSLLITDPEVPRHDYGWANFCWR